MANHITLTSLDGNIVIVDKSRIITCTPFFEIDAEIYAQHMKEYEKQKHLWNDKRSAAFFEDSGAIGRWVTNNPEPERPKESDFQTGNKFTKVTLVNKTNLIVKENTEDIFSKIKEGDF